MISFPPPQKKKQHLKVSSIKTRLKGKEVKKVLTLKAGSLKIRWFNGIPIGKQQKPLKQGFYLKKTFLKDILWQMVWRCVVDVCLFPLLKLHYLAMRTCCCLLYHPFQFHSQIRFKTAYAYCILPYWYTLFLIIMVHGCYSVLCCLVSSSFQCVWLIAVPSPVSPLKSLLCLLENNLHSITIHTLSPEGKQPGCCIKLFELNCAKIHGLASPHNLQTCLFNLFHVNC